MYQQGERVLYGTHGVCEIAGMEIRIIDRKAVEYFVLESLDRQGGRFYVPTQNPAALAKMRPILDRASLLALLDRPEIRIDCWITNEAQRRNRYREILAGSDRTEMLAMVGTLLRHRAELLANGRKFHLSDENFLRDAEKLLYGEASLVLGMDRSQTGEYIRNILCGD